jgi:hypothetical protein
MHVNGENCATCDLKLQGVDVTLVNWFTWVKGNHPEVHIAWGYRGEEDQHNAFLAGKSKLDYPHSPHNHMHAGTPCSLALDVFQLEPDGTAKFDPVFYAALNEETKEALYPIVWGGSFAHLVDMDHFQLSSETP